MGRWFDFLNSIDEFTVLPFISPLELILGCRGSKEAEEP